MLLLILFTLAIMQESVLSLWFQSPSSSSSSPSLTKASPKIESIPFVILPGFGNDAIDYINPLNNGRQTSLTQSLEARGIKNVITVPIKRKQWLNIALGIFTLDFWRSECKPQTLFRFYFTEVSKTVRKVYEEHGPVVLIGHSAGGWLARGMLADDNWQCGDDNNNNNNNNNNNKVKLESDSIKSSDLVLGLVTLGTPHFPPEDGVMCMTRGALQYVDQNYPGAFLKNRKLFYVTVGGGAVQSDETAAKGSPALFASGSYAQVTGSTTAEAGDGITPLRYAHLEGAEQVDIPSAWHSIQAPLNAWYGGSDQVVEAWIPTVFKAIESKSSKSKIEKSKI